MEEEKRPCLLAFDWMAETLLILLLLPPAWHIDNKKRV
jgi:hypothetical protein